MRTIQSLFFIFLLSVATVFGQPVEPPMLYEFPRLCPSCSEPMVLSIRVASETSLLEAHEISSTPILDPEFDDSEYLPGNLIAGPMTNGRTGKIQDWETEIGTKFVEVWEDIVPEMGERYVDEELTKAADEPGESSWSVDNVSVHVEDTGQQEIIQGFPTTIHEVSVSYTEKDFNSDGEETSREDVNYRFQLWLSEEMPFTPLPFHYEPFKENHVPPYNFSPVDDLIISKLLDKIEGQGGLVKSKLIYGGDEWTVELKNVRKTPPVPMHKFQNLPVVASSQVDNFAGPLFIVSLLREGELSEMGSGTIRFGDRELSARSGWKVNDAGDLVVVVTAEDENTTLFLVRPLNGKPKEGTFDVKNRPDGAVLQSMTKEQLSEHANHFQLYGLVSGNPFPTVISGFQSGTVSVESSTDEMIEGRANGEVLALPTDQLSQTESVPFEISFTSETGLENFQFRSPESRVAGR